MAVIPTTHIADYNTSWDGIEGQEVSTFIRLNLNDALTKADNSIKDIRLEAVGNKLTCVLTDANNQESSQTVELKPVSTTKFNVEIINNQLLSVIQKGENLSIPYSYNCSKTVVDENNPNASTTTKVSGHNASIDLTIRYKNSSVTYENFAISAGETYTNMDPVYYLNIPAKYLNAGKATLILHFHEEDGQSLILSEPDAQCNVTIVDMTLTTNITHTTNGNGYNSLFDMTNDSFLFNPVITYAGGIENVMDSNNNSVLPVIVLDAKGGGHLNEYSLNDFTNAFTLSSIRTATSQGSSSLLLNTPYINFYVYAKLTVNNHTILSNIEYYLMACTLAETATSPTAMSKVNVEDVVLAGNPYVRVNQFDSVTIPIYVYNPLLDLTKVKYSLTENNVQDSFVDEKDIRANEINDISFTYNYLQSGTNILFLSANINNQEKSLFTINLDVTNLGSSLSEPTGCAVKLTASGKTSLSDPVWSWGPGENLKVEFDDRFDWQGNGWMNGAMVVNNGATMTINYPICNTQAYTACFRFSTDSAISEEVLISCYDDNTNTGFKIYPEKAVMVTNGKISVETQFLSGSPIEVAFVRYGLNYQYLQAIYINGVMQRVGQMDSNDILTHSLPIEIQATDTSLRLYNINLYGRGLSFTEVQSNYIWNQNDSLFVNNYSIKNNVFTGITTTPGDYGLFVNPDKLPAGSAILIIKPSPTFQEPWRAINSYGGDDPDAWKGVKCVVESVKLIVKETGEELSKLPGNDRNFYAYPATLSAQGTSSMSYPIKNFRFYFDKDVKADKGDVMDSKFIKEGITYSGKTKKMWIGKNVTSSFSYDPSSEVTYPQESEQLAYSMFNNYEGDTYQYKSAPAVLFCLKADYAESSGTHNTGFARMANYALTTSGNIFNEEDLGNINLFSSGKNSVIESTLTPPQLAVADQLNPSYVYDIRTTVDGRPVYLFFETNDGYIYHGKYNMNNEKKSEDVFGFRDITDYTNLPNFKNEATHLKQLFLGAFGSDFTYDDNDNVSYYDKCHGTLTDSSGNTFINPTECWEFSNNTFSISERTNVPVSLNNIASFLFPCTPNNTYPLYNTYPNLDPFTVKDKTNTKLAWINLAWEYRYPDSELSDAGDAAYKNGRTQPYLLKSLYRWLYKHNITLYPVAQRGSVADVFANELGLYFNVNYLLKYYVLTKWFGNVDLRIKNCMLAFWYDPRAIDNTNSESPTGHMRAFYIFYDNDSILGVDNNGNISVPWDAKESWVSEQDKKVHAYPGNGIHAIWDTLEYCYELYINEETQNINAYLLGKKVEIAYQNLRTKLTDEVINLYFEEDLSDYFPDAIKNVDAEVKYFHPLNLVGDPSINGITDPFKLDAMQGSREFHRERWLRKRSRWFDAKFNGEPIQNYKYKFKVSAEQGNSLDGGIIRLLTAIDEWRFYAVSNSLPIDLTSLLRVTNDPQTSIGTLNIPIGTISISDYCTVKGLYGCSMIDFNDFDIESSIYDLNSVSENPSDFGQSDDFSSMPYVKKFILSTNDNQKTKYVYPNAMRRLINGAMFPNIEEVYLCNTASSDNQSNFSDLNLENLTKLRVLDCRGTNIDVLLPRGSSLETLYLEKCTKLTILNKPNITTISLNPTNYSTLKTLTVSNSSSSVYDFVLDFLNARATEDLNLIANIVIAVGTLMDLYTMNKALLLKLSSLATKHLNFKANITITGNVYAPNINDLDIDKGAIGDAFPNLNISSTYNDQEDFCFNNISSTILEENGLITIKANKMVQSWDFDVDDPDPLVKADIKSKIEIVRSNSYECTLKANPTGLNDTITSSKLIVYATRQGGGLTIATNSFDLTKTILIKYQAMTAITLSCSNNIADNTIGVSLYLTQNGTKSNLLTKENLSWSAIGIVNGGEPNSSYTPTITTNTDTGLDSGIITDINYKSTLDTDVKLKASILSIESNTIQIYCDKLIAQDTSTLNNTSSPLYWIYTTLVKGGTDTFQASKYATLYRSTLKEISLSNFLYITYLDGTIYDYENMKFFNYSSTSFEVPRVNPFTNLSVPDNVEYFTWSGSLSGDFSNVLKIVLPEKLKRAYVNLNVQNAFPSSLQFDLSNTTISRIYNPGAIISGASGMPADGDFGISLTANSNSGSSNTLFVYPISNTLTQIGNFKDSIGDNDANAKNVLSMFNKIDTLTSSYLTMEDGSNSSPIYKLGTFGTALSKVKVGSIASYVMSDSAIDSSSYQFISLISHTFWRGSGSTSSMNFNYLTFIGDNTFRNCGNSVSVGSMVEYIGYAAFSGVSNSMGSDFSRVKRIGNLAFSYIGVSLNLTFEDLSLVGQEAFVISNNSSVHHIINYNGTTKPSYSPSSFGTGKCVTLNITDRTIYNELKADTTLDNNVDIQYTGES